MHTAIKSEANTELVVQLKWRTKGNKISAQGVTRQKETVS